MIYQRGTEGSFQQWADLVDDQSYTFDKLLPYFKKSVQFTPPNTEMRAANATAQYNPNAFSSSGGPLHVSFPNYAAPFSTWVAKGLRAIGIGEIDDFNSGKLIGSQFTPLTIRPSDQTRSSSEASFIQSMNGSTANLKIYTGTMAKRVLFDDNKTATGVEVMSNGLTYQINAAKEVIVSAGAFQSPQVLMLSGIGPRATLEQFDIPVVVDLPGVGQNMWDHVLFGPSYRVKVDTFTKVVRDPVYLAEQLVNYIVNKNGPLTSNSADFLGWEKVPDKYLSNFTAQAKQDLAAFPDDWPNIEVGLQRLLAYTLADSFFFSLVHLWTGLRGRLLQPAPEPALRRLLVRYHPRRPGVAHVSGQCDAAVGLDHGQADRQPELAVHGDGRAGCGGSVQARARGVRQRGHEPRRYRRGVLSRPASADGRGDPRGDPEERADGVACCMHMQDGEEGRPYGGGGFAGPRVWREQPACRRCQCFPDPAAWPSPECSL